MALVPIISGMFVNLPDSSGGGATTLDVQRFTADGTWTKPANPVSINILFISDGGGGGSGAVYDGSSVSGGAGGAAGRLIKLQNLNPDFFGDTETVTVGQGGAGGASVSAAGAGNPGSNGTGVTFGSYSFAGGNAGGQGQVGGASIAGAAVSDSIFVGELSTTATCIIVSQAGTACASGGAGVNGGTSNGALVPLGGSGGGGIAAGGVSAKGGEGSQFQARFNQFIGITTVYGNTGGGASTVSTAAGNGLPGSLTSHIQAGLGGGGGGAASPDHVVAPAGNGADAIGYGGGGGGGGAGSVNRPSGKGGNGAPGIIIVETRCLAA